MMSKKIEIDRFVKEISARLPEKVDHVRNDRTLIVGKELKLTGVKDFKGKPIEDHLVYQLEVPVYAGKFVPHHLDHMDGTVEEILLPEIKRADHEQELRRAYLAKGLPGIYSYLAPFLSQESLQKVKDTFMRLSK